MHEEAQFAHFCLLTAPTIQVVSFCYHRCAKQHVPAVWGRWDWVQKCRQFGQDLFSGT